MKLRIIIHFAPASCVKDANTWRAAETRKGVAMWEWWYR